MTRAVAFYNARRGGRLSGPGHAPRHRAAMGLIRAGAIYLCRYYSPR